MFTSIHNQRLLLPSAGALSLLALLGACDATVLDTAELADSGALVGDSEVDLVIDHDLNFTNENAEQSANELAVLASQVAGRVITAQAARDGDGLHLKLADANARSYTLHVLGSLRFGEGVSMSFPGDLDLYADNVSLAAGSTLNVGGSLSVNATSFGGPGKVVVGSEQLVIVKKYDDGSLTSASGASTKVGTTASSSKTACSGANGTNGAPGGKGSNASKNASCSVGIGGGSGTDGEDGCDGSTFTATVKVWYPVGVVTAGGNGGAGGNGAAGGKGGEGWDRPWPSTNDKNGCDGGHGGDGGDGGFGGDGGAITIAYCKAFGQGTMNADGGAAGAAGSAGAGGAGGDKHGKGSSPGSSGLPGTAGQAGDPGEDGDILFFQDSELCVTPPWWQTYSYEFTPVYAN